MADKFEATFGMSDEAMQWLVDSLQKAEVRITQRERRRVALKSLVTTLSVTLYFTVCLALLGWWGYIPAVLGTTVYFTVRDLLR